MQILVPDVNGLTGEQFVALQQAKKNAGIEGPIEVTDRATPGNKFTVGAFGAPGTWSLDQLDRAARTEDRSQNSHGFEDIFDGTELHLDIETYSTVDLKKNTVYRYVEDEHWMILVCSWCIGQGEIHTAYGHEEISGIPGLFDPTVKKIAHNSDFERINFSALKGLPVGTYIDPEEYIDTAVLASLWGYPRSLKGFCKVVGGEAKDEAGGRLINMFSVPNRKGGRTLPEERPADWEAYVEYNRQDVISMRDNIYRLGKGFPSAEEYEAWITATRINDRGIKIDTALAGAAHRQYEANKNGDLARVKEITGLDNPNSVQQFKGWLADQGFEMESIDKAHVAELLERDDLPEEVREAVERKQLAALSAATKYVIAQGSTNSDGRLRGTIKYSNANTGRMCLTGDHEVLTPDGWVRIEDWSGGRIATWNPTGEQIAFSEAKAVHFPYSGEMIHIDSTRIHQISTPDHDMPIRERDGSIEKVPVSELEGKRFFHYIRGSRRVTTKVRDDDLRVLLMVQADGTYPADGGVRLAFRKQRKVERCRRLLRGAELVYVERKDHKTGYTRFTIRAQDCPLWLLMFKDKTFGPWIFDSNPSIFFEELVFWDGSWASSGANSAQYYSTNKTNIDLVQAFAHLSGMYCRVHQKRVDSRNPNWTPLWIANLWFSPGPGTEFRNGNGRNKWSTSEYSGLVHCARTTTGFFLVRREGSVWVTGNSGTVLSPHNLPRDHFTDSEGAHDTEAEQAAIDKLLAGVHVGSEDLKKLVRPLLVGPFTVSDYSAIEARLTAWAAGEDSVLESFRNGEDIYVATAERMGGAKAGFDRQRGKSATLGCIAEGSLVLTDRGLVPIENVGVADKVWDGVEFVRHEGVIYKGQKEVMHYDGLTATPDHKVWASFEGEPRTVRLDYAASCGARLVRTRSGRAPVRMGEDHQSGSSIHPEGLAHADDADRMHWVRTTAVVEPGEPATGPLEGLPVVQQSTRAPEVPGSNPHRGQTAVHESSRSELEALRSEGNHLRLPFGYRSGALDSGEPGGTAAEARTRSCGQRQRLCSWESPLGDARAEYGQPADYDSGRVSTRGLALRGGSSAEEDSTGVLPRTDHRASASCGEGKAQELARNRTTVAVYDIVNAGPRHRFTVSDVLVHNCGFGGGAGALLNLGGAKIYPKGTPDDVIWKGLTSLVETWRVAHPHIVSWWKQVHTAFDKGGPASRRIPVDIEIVGNDRYVWLPSGRALVYHNCRREYVQPKDRNGKPLPYRRRAWVCDAVVGNGTQRRIVGGPTQVENIIQAIGRDLLTHALVNVERAGFRTVTHVHDEIVTETTGGLTVERLSSLMCDLPDWAEGLPVEAAGYTTQRYRKD